VGRPMRDLCRSGVAGHSWQGGCEAGFEGHGKQTFLQVAHDTMKPGLLEWAEYSRGQLGARQYAETFMCTVNPVTRSRI
jgi:hypothetical protein